jgi:sulfite exporter TauE/SafE
MASSIKVGCRVFGVAGSGGWNCLVGQKPDAWIDETIRCQAWLWRNLYSGIHHRLSLHRHVRRFYDELHTQGVKGHGRWAVFFAHLSYALGKNISYALLGAAFGALGAILTVTPQMRGIAALVAGIFLVLYGLSMLRLLPKFRLPSLHSKSGTVTQKIYQDLKPRRSPFIIGILSGFLLGCGPLQAMYILALGTADPLKGVLLLLCFGTGTLIPLLTFGTFASALSAKTQNQLLVVSGMLVILMGLMMIDRGLKLI